MGCTFAVQQCFRFRITTDESTSGFGPRKFSNSWSSVFLCGLLIDEHFGTPNLSTKSFWVRSSTVYEQCVRLSIDDEQCQCSKSIEKESQATPIEQRFRFPGATFRQATNKVNPSPTNAG